jgi:hypothetical protein
MIPVDATLWENSVHVLLIFQDFCWLMPRSLAKFAVRLALVALPLVLLLAYYLYADPFEVLRSYTSYYPAQQSSIWVNRDVASVETFLRQHPQQQYNAFIFGNSRSLFFQTADWQRHVGNQRIFHFDASLESLYGIQQKIKLLADSRTTIERALLVIDFSVLNRLDNDPTPLYTKHYRLSGENWWAFQGKFLKAFLNISFLKSYVTAQITPPLKYWAYDQLSNQISYPVPEDSIRRYPAAYYAKRKTVFYRRDTSQQYYAPVVGTEQIKMLQYIQKVLAAHKADYRVVISPMYDQLRLDSADVNHLRRIFGKAYVFDYSGINAITQHPLNYYERYHYRPHVARQIMADLYRKSPEK